MVYQRGSSTFGMSVEDAYPSTAFDDAGKAPVHLIEVASGGASTRMELTKELVSSYIEKDYRVSLTTRIQCIYWGLTVGAGFYQQSRGLRVNGAAN